MPEIRISASHVTGKLIRSALEMCRAYTTRVGSRLPRCFRWLPRCFWWSPDIQMIFFRLFETRFVLPRPRGSSCKKPYIFPICFTEIQVFAGFVVLTQTKTVCFWSAYPIYVRPPGVCGTSFSPHSSFPLQHFSTLVVEFQDCRRCSVGVDLDLDRDLPPEQGEFWI